MSDVAAYNNGAAETEGIEASMYIAAYFKKLILDESGWGIWYCKTFKRLRLC